MTAECDNGDVALAEQACAQEELKYYKTQVNPDDGTVLKKPTTKEKEKFKLAEDTKMIDFIPGDHSKQFAVRSNLSDK